MDNLNQDIKPKIIWRDPNIDNNENQKYFDELKNENDPNLYVLDTIN